MSPSLTLSLTMAALLAGLAVQPVAAADTRPTEASVRRVFEATHLDTMLDTYTAQIETGMRGGMEHALAGQALNEQQRKILEGMQDKIVALMREELNWASMEPQMIETYRQTFTQHEVDDMLAWYSSPTGRAVIAKQPAAMQQMSSYAQLRVKDLVPKLMQLQKATVAQLEAAATPPGLATPAAPAPAPAPAAEPQPPSPR